MDIPKEFFENAIDVSGNYFKGKGLCGISNMGNTCFMNTIIQCLSASHNFVSYFLSNEYKEDITDCDKLRLEKIFVDSLNTVLRMLYYKNWVVTPKHLFRVIQITALKKGYDNFTGYRQNDCQEFLQFIMETLHNGLSYEVELTFNNNAKNTRNKKLANKAIEHWKTTFEKEFSPIIDMFYGQFYSVINSTTTDFHSDTFEPFSTLPLTIPERRPSQKGFDMKNFKGGIHNAEDNEDEQTFEEGEHQPLQEHQAPQEHAQEQEHKQTFEEGENDDNIVNRTITLYDCLDSFTQPEELDYYKQNNEDTNKYNKTVKLTLLPQNLIIILKRFSKFGSKINTLVDIPLTLDMSKYCEVNIQKKTYDLYAIANHAGGLNGGHYYAYCKNADGNWYKFNDSIVTRINEDQLSTPNAYCLFYH
jgi:ubiquitin C-terminal hydrolase